MLAADLSVSTPHPISVLQSPKCPFFFKLTKEETGCAWPRAWRWWLPHSLGLCWAAHCTRFCSSSFHTVLCFPVHFCTSSHSCSHPPPAQINKVSPALVVQAGQKPRHTALSPFLWELGLEPTPGTTVSLSVSGSISRKSLTRGEGAPDHSARNPAASAVVMKRLGSQSATLSLLRPHSSCESQSGRSLLRL